MLVTQIATEIDASQGEGAAAVPLSERMGQAFARTYVGAGEDLAMIQAASNNPATASSPAALYELQLTLADYTKRMIVAAGLANHANKTVETLLKS